MDEKISDINENLAGPTASKIIIASLLSESKGLENAPAFAFRDDPSGMYLRKEGELAFSSAGQDRAYVNKDAFVFCEPIIICDHDTISPLNNSQGILYKKKNNNGLWWRTENGGEINITDTGIKTLHLQNGSVSNPTHSFNSDGSSGMYLDNGLGFSVGGKNVAHINANGISVSAINLPNGKLHTNPNDTNLYWNGEQITGTKIVRSYVKRNSSKPQGLTVQEVTKLINSKTNIDNELVPIYDILNKTKLKQSKLIDNMNNVQSYLNLLMNSNAPAVFNNNGILLVSGTSFNPSYSYQNDPSTGLFNAENGCIGFASNGQRAGSIDLNQMLIPPGTYDTPGLSFNNNTNSGLVFDDSISVVINKIKSVSFVPNAINLEPSALPSIRFGNNTTGLCYNNGFQFRDNGSTPLIINKNQITLGSCGTNDNLALNFALAPQTGLYVNENDLVLANAETNLVISDEYVNVNTEIRTPSLQVNELKINDSSISHNNCNLKFTNSHICVPAIEFNIIDQLPEPHVGTTMCVKNNKVIIRNNANIRTVGPVLTELFTAQSNLHAGQPVGVTQFGTIDKLEGSKWSDVYPIKECQSSGLSHAYDNDTNSILYTYVNGANWVCANIIISHENKITSRSEAVIKSFQGETAILIALESKKYALIYTRPDESFNLIPISLEDSNIVLGSPKKIGEPTHNNCMSGVYDNITECLIVAYTGLDDNIMYRVISNNFDTEFGEPGILFNIYKSDTPIITKIINPSTIVIAAKGVKIAGFVNSSTLSLTLGAVNNDPDVDRVIDLVYDTSSAIMVAAIEDLGGNPYLQTFDISGNEITLYNKTKITNDNDNILSLSYNLHTDKLILFQNKSDTFGNISAQHFTINHNIVKLGLKYQHDVAMVSCNLIDSNLVEFNTSINEFMLIYHDAALNNLCFTNFNDTYGIPASLFIGVCQSDTYTGDQVEVNLRGSIDSNQKNMRPGLPVYIDSSSGRITTNSCGNVLLGLAISQTSILLAAFTGVN